MGIKAPALAKRLRSWAKKLFSKADDCPKPKHVFDDGLSIGDEPIGDLGPVIMPGNHKSVEKLRKQMKDRGWTDEQINEAVANGKNFPAENNPNPGNGATRYVHPETKRSVVLDNITGEVIHVGGDGFKY